MPPRRPDSANADYAAGVFFVFDDRLGIPDSLKSQVEAHVHLNQFGVEVFGTSAYPGHGQLAVVLKVAPDGRTYALVRKATQRDRRRQRGIFEPPSKPPPDGITAETLVARLDAVDAAIAEIRASREVAQEGDSREQPKHGGMGHNNPDGIDPELVDETADASREVRAALTGPAPNPLEVHRKAGRLRAALGKLGEMAERAPGQFAEGVVKEGGKLALGGVLAANLGSLMHHLSEFLAHLNTWAHHWLP